ncbi:MAG TPA: hypothetical protein VHL53_04035, partial [Acidimicrobiia bacterium]|nr:hypothetical protein [Acidimicrobiia bacterium]
MISSLPVTAPADGPGGAGGKEHDAAHHGSGPESGEFAALLSLVAGLFGPALPAPASPPARPA